MKLRKAASRHTGEAATRKCFVLFHDKRLKRLTDYQNSFRLLIDESFQLLNVFLTACSFMCKLL